MQKLLTPKYAKKRETGCYYLLLVSDWRYAFICNMNKANETGFTLLQGCKGEKDGPLQETGRQCRWGTPREQEDHLLQEMNPWRTVTYRSMTVRSHAVPLELQNRFHAISLDTDSEPEE